MQRGAEGVRLDQARDAARRNARENGQCQSGLPALVVGAVLLLAAFFLFTWGLVSLIAMAMLGQPYAYTVAFFAVFVLYALSGGATAAYGVRTLTSQGMKPERTLRVLKQDQIWLQSEARTRP